MHLCEVTQHIPVLDKGKLNVYRDNLPPMPSEYIVEVEEVQTGLSKIKLTKAVGPCRQCTSSNFKRVGYIPSSTSYFKLTTPYAKALYLTSGNLRE